MHTTDSVFKSLQRALEIAKRLPEAAPTGYSNPWPQVLRLGWEGYAEGSKAAPAVTDSELKEYETTLSWMAFVKAESDRRIVWAAASGMPGYRIAKRCNPVVSQSTISRRVAWALGFITFKLNNGEAPPPFEMSKQAQPPV